MTNRSAAGETWWLKPCCFAGQASLGLSTHIRLQQQHVTSAHEPLAPSSGHASTWIHARKCVTKNKINLYNNKTDQTGQHQRYLKHTSFYIFKIFMYTINFIRKYNFIFAAFGMVLRALWKPPNILPLNSVLSLVPDL